MGSQLLFQLLQLLLTRLTFTTDALVELIALLLGAGELLLRQQLLLQMLLPALLLVQMRVFGLLQRDGRLFTRLQLLLLAGFERVLLLLPGAEFCVLFSAEGKRQLTAQRLPALAGGGDLLVEIGDFLLQRLLLLLRQFELLAPRGAGFPELRHVRFQRRLPLLIFIRL